MKLIKTLTLAAMLTLSPYSGVTIEIAEAASYQKMVKVPALRRKIRPGDVISEGDIIEIDVNERRARAYMVQDAADIVGLAAQRPLMPGKPLRLADFDTPSMIEKGARVTMVLRAGGLRLTALGTAMQDAHEGGYVRVKNHDSRQTVQGRVIAPNLVEILPVGQLALLNN